jgi:putative membrane protein
MHRRHALAGLASAIAIPSLIGAAFAQNAPSSASQATGNAGAHIGEAEAKYAADTLAAGSASLAASRIALKKAADDDVKEFAQFEVAEQETIADVLKAMRDQGTPATGQVKPPSEAEVTGQLDAKGKAMVESLQSVKGKEFDRAYIRGQIEGHHALLKIQEAYLSSGKDREALAVAKLARGQIREHLTLLGDIEDDLKG